MRKQRERGKDRRKRGGREEAKERKQRKENERKSKRKVRRREGCVNCLIFVAFGF